MQSALVKGLRSFVYGRGACSVAASKQNHFMNMLELSKETLGLEGSHGLAKVVSSLLGRTPLCEEKPREGFPRGLT